MKPGDAKGTGGSSVNADTDWHKVLECRFAEVMTEIITRIL